MTFSETYHRIRKTVWPRKFELIIRAWQPDVPRNIDTLEWELRIADQVFYGCCPEEINDQLMSWLGNDKKEYVKSTFESVG